jgi:hypothetical protein
LPRNLFFFDKSVPAWEIVEDFEAALERFREIAADLAMTKRMTDDLEGEEGE